MNVTPIRQTVDQQGNRVIPNVSIETSLIVQKFKENPKPGFFLSDKEISDMIGCDVKGRGQGYVQSAKRILIKSRIVVERVKMSGYRVATGDGATSAAFDQIARMRRMGNRSKRLFEVADEATMSPETKRKNIAGQNVLGAMKMFAKTSAVEKMEHLHPGELLPSGKVLDLFK